MQTYRLFIIIPIAILTLSIPVFGQDNNSSEGCNFCFRGKPKGKCCSFLILESGLLSRISGSGQPSDKAKFLFTTDLGLMFNRSNSSAIGGSFHLAADDDGSRFGFGPRYRRWLNKGLALDLSPRLLIAGTDPGNGLTIRYPAFSFSASLAIQDLLSIDAYFEFIPYEQEVFTGIFTTEIVKGTQKGIYLGASGRSWAALAVPIAFIIAIAIEGDSYGPTF